MKTKWRGIKTTSKKINEKIPKTIINRLGQKTMSLPRITDDKRWAGYPGISGVAKKIAMFVPPCKYYVEPFAGAAKVFQELQVKQFDNVILNDKSKFIRQWLRKEFNFPIITNQDFVQCVKKWDSFKTFFLFDEPWFKSSYQQDFSYFNRESVKQYDLEVIDLCRHLKAKFIITTRKENKIMLNSGFNNFLLESIYKVSGKLPRVLITTNLEIEKVN